jgi:hypothetical protein
MNLRGQFAIPHPVGRRTKCGVENGPDFRIHKVGFGSQEGLCRIAIQLTGKIETMEPLFFEHTGPFFRFQGDTVGSGESGGYEADVMNLVKGDIHSGTCMYEMERALHFMKNRPLTRSSYFKKHQ